MNDIRKPMLAVDYDESKLSFPCYGSYKIDGFRGFVENGVLLTRSGKPMSNKFAQQLFGRRQFEGMDGELVVGSWNDRKVFEKTSGELRRAEGTPDVTFYVFDDRTHPEIPFYRRHVNLKDRVSIYRHYNHLSDAQKVVLVEQKRLMCLADLEAFEQEALAAGFEGVMLRSIEGPYKFGRSTLKEGYLLKVKRFVTAEATIVGFKELMHNTNEAFEDELGRTKRSEAAEGLVGSAMIGSFIVSSPEWPRDFQISAGSMTHDEKRAAFIEFETKFKGQHARYSYFPHGTKDVPRHGIFDGLRAPEDL